MNSSKVRLGVVGVGKLGYHHARLIANLENAILAGIVDTDTKRALAVSREFNCRVYESPEKLAGEIDGAIIAVPTISHHNTGRIMLERSIHCLIEKPIAGKLTEAEELIELSENRNCILQVGHVERFNPAVLEMKKHVVNPVFIEANRLGPYDPRVSDVGVVMDLMIHDIDIILSLVKDKVVKLDVVGASVFTQHADIAKATITFANGCRADVAASRITDKKFRKIRIFQAGAYISLDYGDSSLVIYKKKNEIVRDLRDIAVIKPRIPKCEPLKSELEHFVDCIKLGKSPLVTGQHGRDAVELALEITRSMALHTA